MNRFKDPLKEHRDLMASLSDPLIDIRASMALVSDPLKDHRDMMVSLSDPLIDIRASMALMSDPLKEHRDMMASLSDPLKDIRASMALISDPLKDHRDMMASLSDPLKNFRATIAGISNPLRDIRSFLTDNNSLELIKDIALKAQAELTIAEDGLVSLSSRRIAAAELQELSSQIFHESSLLESNSLEDSINNLINEIRSQKDPLTQKILMWFIYPLIVAIVISFINPIVDHHVRSYLNESKRALVKELKVSVNSTIGNKGILETLRYVSTDILNVRASSSAKSETVGYLRFSSVVLVIEKQKSWTLIEWNDPGTDAQITGWVFSRYLEKFR